MDILPTNFKALQFCGAWQERKGDNVCVEFLHFCYRYAVFLLIYECTTVNLIEVIRKRDHIDELTEGLFLGLTLFTLCIKYANFLLRKNEISALLDCLRVKMCQPKNSVEKLIIEEHNRKAKWSTISFMALSYVSAVGMTITAIVELLKKNEHTLPLKVYVPYSVSDLLPYLATFLQQILAMFYAVMLNISFDCLVYGFTIHACAQIDLMCYRLTDSLRNISSGRKSEVSTSIEECVRHHLLVNILVKKMRGLFMWTVMIFFFFSMIIVCTSIFLISKKKLLSLDFLFMFMYLSGVMLQIFFYCWYGNELELKSKNITSAIYSSDWTMATPRERKLLIFVMINSQKGIMFSYHGLFALSLQTFTWICRTSYSAYNLLQQASN
ncbi:odorant receptor 82a-like isoform X2 [Linepithema humile]|uniref:odorant receptor 82a-like isoform X2 n=1 Tax=Linepithema humile TaxID=83485 RepID=UPI00351F2C30